MPLDDPTIPDDCPIVGDWYRHFKGGLCKVLAVSRHTETGELLITYLEHGSGLTFCRPWASWCDWINSVKLARFTFVGRW